MYPDDTPVWMLWRGPKTKAYEAILVAWYNRECYSFQGYLTLKTFGTQEDAEEYLKDFWDSYWRVLG